jgi:hypothetical protein
MDGYSLKNKWVGMIRTTEQLVDRIAEDLIWRRRELTDLRGMAQEFKSELRSRVVIRAAVALLYAHWEGFVKKTSSYYLEFVSSHRLQFKRLSPNFVALTIRSKFIELGASEKVSGANALAEFFCSSMERQSNVPYKNVVETRSNLSSKVLEDIVAGLGLNLEPFETKLKYIDKNLVNPRNYVAHGEVLDISLEEYLELHDTVIGLIETFRNEIENASVERRFERV